MDSNKTEALLRVLGVVCAAGVAFLGLIIGSYRKEPILWMVYALAGALAGGVLWGLAGIIHQLAALRREAGMGLAALKDQLRLREDSSQR